MKDGILTVPELDAIGEVFGIGFGGAANTLSQVLDKPVSISKISAVQDKISDINTADFKSGVYAAVSYSGDINGESGMVWTAEATVAVLNILMMTDTKVDENFALDEMSVSTIQEIFNMMMQTCAQSVGEFLQKKPLLALTGKVFAPAEMGVDLAADNSSNVMYITFTAEITEVSTANFIYIISPTLAENMVEILTEMGMLVPDAPPQPVAAPAPQPQAAPQPQPQQAAPQPQYAQGPEYPLQQGQPYQNQAPLEYQYNYVPPVQYDYSAQWAEYYRQLEEIQRQAETQLELQYAKAEFADFGKNENSSLNPDTEYLKTNMDNMMNVQLRIVAELGRVPLKMKDILNLKVESVIDINRPAGAPVQIIANKQPIGTGDVVVIGDNFYIRVVEIHNDLRQKRGKK